MKKFKKHQVVVAKFAASTLLVAILSACNSGNTDPEYIQPKQDHSLKAGSVEGAEVYKKLCFINETKSPITFSVKDHPDNHEAYVHIDEFGDEDLEAGVNEKDNYVANEEVNSGETACVSLDGVIGQPKLTIDDIFYKADGQEFSEFLGTSDLEQLDKNIGGNKFMLASKKNDIDLNISSQDGQVNVSVLDSSVKEGMKNWMSYLDGNTVFNKITLPASHDAGMGEITSCTLGLIAKDEMRDWGFLKSNVAKNQSTNIKGQLTAGARMFDIRMEKSTEDSSSLVTFHKAGGVGCQGEYISSILDGVTSFLKENDKEVAILRVTHTGGEDMDKFFNLLLQEKYKSYLADVQKPLWLNDVEDNMSEQQMVLDEVAGKIIVIIDPKFQELAVSKGLFNEQGDKLIVLGEKLNDTSGIVRYNLVEESQAFGNTFGGFANSQQLNDVTNKILRVSNEVKEHRLNNPSNPFGRYLSTGFQASWTYTGGFAGFKFWDANFNIPHLAAQINFYLPTKYTELSKNLGAKPNLVNLDYISPLLSAVIVKTNGVDFNKFSNHKDEEVIKHDKINIEDSYFHVESFSQSLTKILSELRSNNHYEMSEINKNTIEIKFENSYSDNTKSFSLTAETTNELVYLAAMRELLSAENSTNYKRVVNFLDQMSKQSDVKGFFNLNNLQKIKLNKAEYPKYLNALRDAYLPPVSYNGDQKKTDALRKTRLEIADMIAKGGSAAMVFNYVDDSTTSKNLTLIKENRGYTGAVKWANSFTALNTWLGRTWSSGWIKSSWELTNDGKNWYNLVRLIKTTEGC